MAPAIFDCLFVLAHAALDIIKKIFGQMPSIWIFLIIIFQYIFKSRADVNAVKR